MKIINEKLLSRLFIIGIIVMICLVVLAIIYPVSAAENVTNETDYVYENSDEYIKDLDYWYNYYTNDRSVGYESKLRDELESLLISDTLSNNDRNEAILIKLGWDFRLKNYMDETKRSIDKETGAVTYSLGIGNWWANLFNSGVDESKLPKSIAEGDALYKIYSENYGEWVNLLKGEKT